MQHKAAAEATANNLLADAASWLYPKQRDACPNEDKQGRVAEVVERLALLKASPIQIMQEIIPHLLLDIKAASK